MQAERDASAQATQNRYPSGSDQPEARNQHPFEPLRANRIWGAGWVDCFGRCVPDPLRGGGLPRPPVGGWGGYSRALWTLGRCLIYIQLDPIAYRASSSTFVMFV